MMVEHTSSCTEVQNIKMGTLVPFQIAGKLRGTCTDKGFKQVPIAYLAVISNLD